MWHNPGRKKHLSMEKTMTMKIKGGREKQAGKGDGRKKCTHKKENS